MPRFAANLSMLFTEVPFLERFARAAAAGFAAVEFLFPYEHDPADLRRLLDLHALRQVLFNLPAGNWAAGDRGTAALSGRREEFRAAVETAITYARALDCPRLHAMAGVTAGEANPEAAETRFIDNMRFAADRAAADGITILIEALNDRDVPGYFVAHQLDALALVRKIDRPNVSVQLDYYHAQIMDGDLTHLTERLTGRLGHVQVASVPDRHEPDQGEIRYRHVFDTLDRIGYTGWVGCEYVPRGETEAGLAWMRPYLKA